MRILIGDQIHSVPLALAPDADRFAGSQATDVISMAHASSVAFVVSHGTGATGTYAVTVEACDDTVPTTTTAVAFRYRTLTTAGGLDTWSDWQSATAAGITQAAGSSKALFVEVTENELADGMPYVRLATTEAVDSPVDGAIVALVNRNYQGGAAPSVLT